MSKIVIMAEKRNAAEDIAKALKIKNISREGNQKFIRGILPDENRECVIVWSNGHCLELLEPVQIDEKYKTWNEKDLPIPFDDEKLNVIPDKYQIFKAIKEELATADKIINAGDAGREGELIQRWILSKVFKNSSAPPVYRLWAQSLTEKSLYDAYNHLLGINENEEEQLNNLYDAGRARAIMDKYLGYNYSRLISKTKTDGLTVNYGRCKTPLTHAIIERDLEIENFVSKPFSYIEAFFESSMDKFKGTLIDEKEKRIEFETEREAEEVKEKIKNKINVEKVEVKEKYLMPPQPYDILNIQKQMAKKYGYEADETLAICQALYDKHHLISYPRTDSRFLTTDLKDEMKEHLEVLDFGKFSNYVKAAKGSFIPDKYFNDGKVTDHHALIPVVPDKDIKMLYDSLDEKERTVYDAIIMSFIALWFPNYEFETKKLILSDGNYRFMSKGKREINLGWKQLFKDEINEEEEKIGNICEGDELFINEKNIINSKTTPKSRFTTATLLDYMKVHHIGTGATRDTIIKELQAKKGQNAESSVRKEGKHYISTEFGRMMDKVIPDDIKTIDYLSVLEMKLTDIADGKLSLEEFLYDIDSDFRTKKQEMISHKEALLVKENPNKKVSKFCCNICGQPLIDRGWGYGCKGWKKDGSGCNFSISKDYFGKKLTDKVIEQLLTSGKTKSKLKLKKKAGGTYEAYLVFVCEEGKWKIKPSFK